jgi:hypothetical protein
VPPTPSDGGEGRGPYVPRPVGIHYAMPHVGEGLLWVAETWGLDTGCLADANRSENPDTLAAGEVLTIPAHCRAESGPRGDLVFTANTQGTGLRAFALRQDGAFLRPTPGEVEKLCAEGNGSPRLPSKSPDGTWIAEIETTESASAPRFGELSIRRTGESETTFPVIDEPCAAEPVWSPNGMYLAFRSTCGEPKREQIWVVPAPHVRPPALSGHLAIDLPGIRQLRCWAKESP